MGAETPKAGPTSQDGIFSLEDLDKIIEAEDPNFKNEMEGIKSSGVTVGADFENLQVKSEDEPSSKDEESEADLKTKIIHRLTKPWRSLGQFLKLKFVSFKNRLVLLKESSKAFIRHGLPERLKYYRSRLTAASKWFQGEVNKLNALSRAEKTGIVLMTLGSIATIFILSKTLTGGWLPHFSDPLTHSLGDQASFVKSYRQKDELQDLFQAFPEVEYQVLLKKVIVNLKADENSGPNPMGIFEMYVGVDSQDTAIEVKDREREILDLIQRTLENFAYSDTNSMVGKIRMKSAVRDRLNEILNQGKVFHVYFNTFITNY